MMPEAAVAFATFVIVLLVLNRWTRDDTEIAVEDDGVAAARQLIAARIDEQIEALTQSYLNAGGAPTGGDEVPGSFAQKIEHFIATALTSDGTDQGGLGAAVRCVVTLEREHIYALVLARVRDHLTSHRPAA
jgi:hypothetical protein